MEKQLTTKQANELFGAILSLKSAKECKAFLRDLCTLSEIEAMIERLRVAKMVKDNIRIAYRNGKLVHVDLLWRPFYLEKLFRNFKKILIIFEKSLGNFAKFFRNLEIVKILTNFSVMPKKL